MQNPNEDTEWNDVLRSKGIIPPKEKEISEDQILSMLEETIQQKSKNDNTKDVSECNLDELDELEDDEDDDVIQQWRAKRIAEMRHVNAQPTYGSLIEITGVDYVQEVNKAGEGVWVVLCLYKTGIPFCSLVLEHLKHLAWKYPKVKFVRGISDTCVPNFPEKCLPTVFVYLDGELKKQFLGPLTLRGPNLTQDELEYLLGQVGALDTTIQDDPRPAIKDKLFSDLAESNDW